jgi:hypothetical protein
MPAAIPQDTAVRQIIIICAEHARIRLWVKLALRSASTADPAQDPPPYGQLSQGTVTKLHQWYEGVTWNGVDLSPLTKVNIP